MSFRTHYMWAVYLCGTQHRSQQLASLVGVFCVFEYHPEVEDSQLSRDCPALQIHTQSPRWG